MDPIKEWALWAIMLLPLSSFAIISVVSFLGWTRSGGIWSPRLSGYLTILAILGSFLLSLWAFDTVVDSEGARVGFESHPWLEIGPLDIRIGVALDGLTGVMLVVVTGVSLLVQIYSQEYMRGDEGYSRYFAYMSLFTASMLGLILASSILQIFIFWELVGLCSYLLIGFWFYKDSARKAATKAFLVTRIGDIGFMIGLLIVFAETGTLDILEIQEAAIAGAIGSTALTWFALGLFAGAAGKSAQFPLHVWLPDAMEGPTPVSALIHAATMVAAGVYLVARFFPVFAESSDAMFIVALIGSITAIIAALLGIVSTDIKRVMAYSTISQLGYMMMALGAFGMVAAIFHLFTHAFFKSLLFLGSGSVNHATGTFDMRKMGGLAGQMPITFITMLIGSLALVGVFPLSGFWSKDEILADAWLEREWVFVVGMIGVFLTALYVGRMLILTFGGEYKGGEQTEDDHGGHHGSPHESPILMVAPMMLLAVMAAFSGFLNLDDWLGHIIEGWLPEHTEELVAHSEFSTWIAVSSGALGLFGLLVAWLTYGVRLIRADRVRGMLGPIPSILENRYYLDYLYQDVFLKFGLMGGLATVTAMWDKYVIDDFVNGLARLASWTGDKARMAQTGQPQLYASVMFIGSIAAVVGILLVSGN